MSKASAFLGLNIKLETHIAGPVYLRSRICFIIIVKRFWEMVITVDSGKIGGWEINHSNFLSQALFA